MVIESAIVLAASASAFVGIILAVWVFARIIDIRDRRRARYRLVWGKDQKTPTGITDHDHSVKLINTRKGYRLDFYDGQGHHVYTVDLEKVDSSVNHW